MEIKCYKCRIKKHHDEFHKSYTRKLGYTARCKPCAKEYNLQAKRTKEGVCKHIYGDQCGDSKSRGHNPPTYSKTELIKWLLSQSLFHTLYINWVNSNYYSWDRPLCDRIDNTKSYSFNNLKLMTWRENDERQKKAWRSGEDNSHGHKPIHHLDLKNNFIKRYVSISAASRATGIHSGRITQICKDTRNRSGTNKFVYE